MSTTKKLLRKFCPKCRYNMAIYQVDSVHVCPKDLLSQATFDNFVLTTGHPDNNPKTQFGIKKLPLHLAPPALVAYAAWAFADGAGKYGPYNWRDKTISASVYVAALKRHIDAWFDGEVLAEDSQIPHLAHAVACLGMIIDGVTNQQHKFNDDRPPSGGAASIQQQYAAWSNARDARRESESRDRQVVEAAPRVLLEAGTERYGRGSRRLSRRASGVRVRNRGKGAR